MNLHGIVSGAIGTVNPLVTVQLLRSIGATTADDGTRIPKFAPPENVSAQIQALTFTDLQQLDGLNIQGERRAVYINGRADAVLRPSKKGGDLIITPDKRRWLIVLPLEYWPDWCKFAITLQNEQ